MRYHPSISRVSPTTSPRRTCGANSKSGETSGRYSYPGKEIRTAEGMGSFVSKE